MTSVQDITQNLTDSQATMMIRTIHDRIFNAVDFDAIEGSIQDEAVGQTLLELSDDQLAIELDTETSVGLSRKILQSMAEDEDFSDIITDVWDEVQNDDSMFVGSIIALGLIANLTLFMVSSKIEVKFGNMTIIKDKVDTEAVKAIMAPLAETIKRV